MGFNSSSGVTQVTGNVNTNASFATPTTLKVAKTILHNGNASKQTAYTVPAGKRFHLFSASISANVIINGRVYDVGDTNLLCNIFSAANTGTQTDGGGVAMETYEAGDVVSVLVTAGNNIKLTGVLETV